ncbi:sensor domain-containing diguanylate cyclase [Levilinea saccharolytica]|uniref:sensor domain-containing diguanylate cyclase n=1 Tax=Levilinea saccharolytica TaxID=229921 RepID=UPI0007811640|nr:diguanylate cyclase [Levilinea saccharolytica]GAP17571.1 protein containing diguanylate cyclase (GGDEF) domain [Levilinea saccharolytica]
MKKRTIYIATALLLLILMGSMILVVQLLEATYHAEQNKDFQQLLEVHGSQIQLQINRSLSAGLALSMLIHQNNGVVPGFSSLSENMTKIYSGIDSIYLAPGGLVSQAYNPDSGQSFMGINVFEHPAYAQTARTARDEHRMILSAPVRTSAGQSGIMGWQPVYLLTPDQQEYFWGFVLITLDFSDLTQVGSLANLREHGLNYELTFEDQLTPYSGLVDAVSPTRLQNPIRHIFTVNNLQFTLSAAPSAGWKTSPGYYPGLAVALLSSIFISFLVYRLLTQSRQIAQTNITLKSEVAKRQALTDMERISRNLAENRLSELQSLQSLSSVLNHAATLNQTLQEGLGVIRIQFQADAVWVILFQVNQNPTLAAVLPEGLTPHIRDEHLCACSHTHLSENFHNGTPVPPYLVESCALLRHLFPDQPENWSHMTFPIQTGDRPLGLLNLMRPRSLPFSAEDITRVQSLCAPFAVAIERARLFEEVHRLAITDPLTGAYNRRYFLDQAAQECQRAQRYRHAVSLIMMDLDHFKQINDSFGHTAGDQVLRFVIAACQENLRAADLLARFGGEEFIILLPETPLEQAQLIAERIRQSIVPAQVITSEGPVQVRVSLGVASSDENAWLIDDLIKRADQALYQAKTLGRNRTQVWMPILTSDSAPSETTG